MATSMPSTTIVLMGKTGNGKSATGNSILGEKTFKSIFSFGAVTQKCKEGSVILPNGRVVRVIDTPGFFEASEPQNKVQEELIKCLELAKDGVHAVLLVMSVGNRFTAEEDAVVKALKRLFGDAVMRHVILLFTGGDKLLELEMTLKVFLEKSPIIPLNDIIDLCGNRVILFDNKTKDKEAKDKQMTELLELVDFTVRRNEGKPYSNELFEAAKAMAEKKEQKARELAEARDEATKQQLKAELVRDHAEQLRALNEQLGGRLNELQAELGRDHAEQLRALNEQLGGRLNELQAKGGNGCTIL